MKRAKQQIRGFTLIEVLIASSIFAVVMMIVTATVFRMTAYHSKLKITREATEESRRIVDQISRDLRAARGGVKVSVAGNEYSSGFILMNCLAVSPGCLPVNEIQSNAESANTLILFSVDSYKIYYIEGNKLYFLSETASPTDLINIWDLIYGSPGGMVATDNVINRTDYDHTLLLNGFAPTDANRLEQPYLEINLTVKTPNYDTLPPADRSQSVVKTTVASRNYK